jgi:NTP pyrophosphatase (non-canonical NTP hydrolase)
VAADFGIGSRRWPGVAKLLEEMGELQQELAKLVATGGGTEHWDGNGDLRDRIENEMGDVIAAIFYAMAHNPQLRSHVVRARADLKEQRFNRWHEQELPGSS